MLCRTVFMFKTVLRYNFALGMREWFLDVQTSLLSLAHAHKIKYMEQDVFDFEPSSVAK